MMVTCFYIKNTLLDGMGNLVQTNGTNKQAQNYLYMNQHNGT